MKGIITKSISSFYYVDTGEEVYECRARGIFKHMNQKFYAGDKVEFEVTDEVDKEGSIFKLFPRDNLLIRPPIANASQGILVFSVKDPDPNLSLIDRFMVLAQIQRLEIVIVLNKIDIDTENIASHIRENYGKIGYPVIAISAENKVNLEAIKPYLENHVSIVAGPSGAGKSTLINGLIETGLKTGEVSQKIGRGRHTTRYVELIKIDKDSYIADSPGFSSIDLPEMDEYELKEHFIEFHEYDVDCKFGAKCLHEMEPGCMVKEAVENEEISKVRYESYLQLLNEIRDRKRRNY